MTEAVSFGTDGWRGRIADAYTFANLRRAARAAALFYKDKGGAAGVVIGHDRRFLARAFAEAAAEVVAAAGVPVWITADATPTPVISHSILDKGAAGAINLTASHNPPSDMGFKVRDSRGAALDPDALADLVARLPAAEEEVPRVDFGGAVADGRIRVFDPAPAYRDHVAAKVDLRRLAAAGLQVAYDPMWGAGIGWLPWLLGPGAKTRFPAIHDVPNPNFPGMGRPEPIPPNTDALGRHVRAIGADLGIANDGDADRIGLYDEAGRFVDQLQVYGLLAYYLLEVRGERRPIVKTLSTTTMLDLLGTRYGVAVHETGIGFKYVGPKMMETDAMIGGEESGGFAFRGLPERDGLLAALLLMDLVLEVSCPPSQLLDVLEAAVGGRWAYGRRDVGFEAARRPALLARLEAAAPQRLAGVDVVGRMDTDGFKFLLSDGGWILIRFSGTEPLLRIYAETPQPETVAVLLEAGLELTGLAADD